MARNKYLLDEENMTVTFPNGKVYSVDELQEDIKRRLALHGLKQKLSDAMAVSKDLELSEEEKFELADRTYEGLKGGSWTLRAEGGGGGGSQLDTAAKKYLDGEFSKQERAMLETLGLWDKIVARAKKLEEKGK